MSGLHTLVFVDCEANGPCPGKGVLTEFGAVHYESRRQFHGVLYDTTFPADGPAIPNISGIIYDQVAVFSSFERWLADVSPGKVTFVSDNPAFDWQWINHGFHHTIGRNPFGFSARRISDFYAGLVGDFNNSLAWKRLRVTPHDHNPVNDALGNVEAFARLIGGER